MHNSEKNDSDYQYDKHIPNYEQWIFVRVLNDIMEIFKVKNKLKTKTTEKQKTKSGWKFLRA